MKLGKVLLGGALLVGGYAIAVKGAYKAMEGLDIIPSKPDPIIQVSVIRPVVEAAEEVAKTVESNS